MFQCVTIPGLNSRAWTASLWTVKQRRLQSFRTRTHTVLVYLAVQTPGLRVVYSTLWHFLSGYRGEQEVSSLSLSTHKSSSTPRHLQNHLSMKLPGLSPSIVPDATLETPSSRSIHFTSLSWSSSHCKSEKIWRRGGSSHNQSQSLNHGGVSGPTWSSGASGLCDEGSKTNFHICEGENCSR